MVKRKRMGPRVKHSLLKIVSITKLVISSSVNSFDTDICTQLSKVRMATIIRNSILKMNMKLETRLAVSTEQIGLLFCWSSTSFSSLFFSLSESL